MSELHGSPEWNGCCVAMIETDGRLGNHHCRRKATEQPGKVFFTSGTKPRRPYLRLSDFERGRDA